MILDEERICGIEDQSQTIEETPKNDGGLLGCDGHCVIIETRSNINKN